MVEGGGGGGGRPSENGCGEAGGRRPQAWPVLETFCESFSEIHGIDKQRSSSVTYNTARASPGAAD